MSELLQCMSGAGALRTHAGTDRRLQGHVMTYSVVQKHRLDATLIVTGFPFARTNVN